VLDRGQRADWFASPWVVYATLIAVGSLTLLVFRELRFADPILDMRMFKLKDFTLSVFLILAMVLAVFANLLLNPVFLQEFMGYSASKAGLAMAPRAIAALCAMFFVGQIARFRYDTRPLIAMGFALMAFGMWVMSHWNLEVSMWAICWPTVPFGIGSGLIFPTLSAKSLACVERERIGYASSLFNMMRNTGAALGISFVVNLLTSYEQVHQTYLVQHFSSFEAWKLSQQGQRLPGAMSFSFIGEIVTGQKQGLGMIYRMVQAQAAMLSFNDIYRMIAVMMLVLIPVALFLSRGQGSTSRAVH